jgi:probable HAF family extracellular repeat protein
VTGAAFTGEDRSEHALRTAPNRAINPATDDLGTLGAESYGMAINDLGQVVGYSFTTRDHTVVHAFLFSGSLMYDLNNLIPAGFGWDLQQAFGINDVGQIVGIGAHSGVDRPFLLTPASKDLCKNRGWENFGFKDQGQCIQFVETGK